MNEIQQYIPDQEARTSLAKKLSLEYDERMQDWEYEVSDYNRLSEFISEYDKSETTNKEREALMEIMLDSLNDVLLAENFEKFETYFSEVQERLSINAEIHSGTLHYWKSNNFQISEKLK